MVINRVNVPRRSAGIALVVALIMLLVLTLLGVAMMNSSNLQERMSGNQKRIADSSMAAEAALQEHIGWLRENPAQRWASVHPEHRRFVNYGFSTGGDASSQFFIHSWWSFNDRPLPCSATDRRCVLNVLGQSVGGEEVLAQTALRAILGFERGSVPLGGAKDIWTDGTIRINGNAFLTNTYVHSNGDLEEVRITGGNTVLNNSSITANGNTNVNLNPEEDFDRCIDCSIIGVAGLDDPPPDFVTRIEYWRQEVGTVGEVTFTEFNDNGDFDRYGFPSGEGKNIANPPIDDFGGSGHVDCGSALTFPLDLSNFESGDVIFVNGNVSLSGGGANSSFANITVIATCDMEHNGAIRQSGGGSGEINNVFYAGGDMTFNGATRGNEPDTEFQGRFFAGGHMTQNGRSLLTGQIILNGDLTLNGSFNFTGANSLGGNADTSPGTGEVRLLDWAQMWGGFDDSIDDSNE